MNKKGFTLPQTGGLGTLTLSVIGCALVLGGALVLVNSKKRAK
ncbi:MAG: LPXTG cell wall anchor domain-containing protein [Oscillospiraceae bacterium]|nr:LPXTG cell wall anchor domain-containing protein [Oscillospiraceae bacterium]